MALGVIYLAMVVPQAVTATRNVMRMNQTIDPRWPPAFREQLEREMDQTWENFYLWIAAVIPGVLLLSWGTVSSVRYLRR